MKSTTIGLRMAMVGLCALSGCRTEDRDLLGRYQVGDAGGTCSFLTTMLAGPGIGRGRNEGQMKSDDEIASLWGPFAVREKLRFRYMASTGMGLEEYNAIGRSALTINSFEDTLITGRAVIQRKVVTKQDIKRFYEALFRGHFLNTDVLVDCRAHGPMDPAKIRDQFWRWIGYTFKSYRMDYYILDGNRHMIRKLHAAQILTEREAVYLLARWFLVRTRLEASMLEDLEHFKIITTEQMAHLIRIELAYLAHFNISPTERQQLLAQQGEIYESIRGKLRWPLTIPATSQFKAIAPSYRNVYAEAYDTGMYVRCEYTEVPKSRGSYFGYDPRIAVSINDGRRLSNEEKLSRFGVGTIVSAIRAAGGETQTGYVFRRRLDSPSSSFNMRLVATARRQNVISQQQHVDYIKATMAAGLFSRHTYLSAREYGIPVLQSLPENELFMRRCFVNGLSYEDYRFLRRIAGGQASYDKALDVLRAKLDNSPWLVSAITILCAEQDGEIAQPEANALLKVHFYHLMERLAHAQALTVRIDSQMRMRRQRLKVDQALFQYHFDKAMEELDRVQAGKPE